MNVLFAAIVALTNLCGVVGVDTHGARVASYVTASGGEIFFTSATGTGGSPSSSGEFPKNSAAAAMPTAPIAAAPQKQLRQA